MKRPPEDTPDIYAQDGMGYDAIVYAHYFAAGSDWLVTEYDPATDTAFGWACMNSDRQMAELGYTSLAELESAKIPIILWDGDREIGRTTIGVEYDEHWQQVPLKEAIETLDRQQGL